MRKYLLGGTIGYLAGLITPVIIVGRNYSAIKAFASEIMIQTLVESDDFHEVIDDLRDRRMEYVDKMASFEDDDG